jgi:hypothetical protein
MLKKVRQTIFQIKALIIVLIVLIAVGWGLAIYFGLKAQTPIPATCVKRLEKLNSYAVLLDESTQLARQEKSFDTLEMNIHLLDNGTLLAEWEDVVFGGNQKEDLENYFDVIIDALKFFSK